MTRADGEVQVVRKRTGILSKQPGPVSWHDPSSPRALDGQDGRTAQLWFEVVGASSTCRRDVSHELPAPVPSDPRYFEGGDPNTGQFTQEDPLGLAGGMNVYGFANGDPVDFSDPFGLSCKVVGNCSQSDVPGPPPVKVTQDKGAQAVALGFLLGALTEGFGGGSNISRVANEAMSADAVALMDAGKIRFSQESMSAEFQGGGKVSDLATALKEGRLNPNEVVPIRVVELKGKLFTLDNRRLWAFQQAGVPVPYRMATPEEFNAERWKFTTPNDGTSIRVRGQP